MEGQSNALRGWLLLRLTRRQTLLILFSDVQQFWKVSSFHFQPLSTGIKVCRFTYFAAGLVTVISCQTSCTNDCVSFFLSITPTELKLDAGGRFPAPVTTSVELGSRGDAGGVNDVGPEQVTASVLGSTDPSAEG